MSNQESHPSIDQLLKIYRNQQQSGTVEMHVKFGEWLDKYWHVVVIQKSRLSKIIEVLDNIYQETENGYRIKTTSRIAIRAAIGSLTGLMEG